MGDIGKGNKERIVFRLRVASIKIVQIHSVPIPSAEIIHYAVHFVLLCRHISI